MKVMVVLDILIIKYSCHHLYPFEEKLLCCGLAEQWLCFEPPTASRPPHSATAGRAVDPKQPTCGITSNLWLNSESLTHPILNAVYII